MYRLYDWRCRVCERTDEHLTQCRDGTKPKRQMLLCCRWCGVPRVHDRMISPPAPYMGERVINPMVRGGRFDTMGHEAPPMLPDLPSGVESTTSNYRQLFATPEWKEARAEQKEVARRNAQKRKRAAAIERGENINMRRDKCDGDPKVTA